MPVTLSQRSAGWRGAERRGCLTGRSWVGVLATADVAFGAKKKEKKKRVLEQQREPRAAMRRVKVGVISGRLKLSR